MYEKNPAERGDHFWRMSMKTLKIKTMVVEFDEKTPEIIDEWYMRKGLPTPPWRQEKPSFDADGNIINPYRHDA